MSGADWKDREYVLRALGLKTARQLVDARAVRLPGREWRESFRDGERWALPVVTAKRDDEEDLEAEPRVRCGLGWKVLWEE